MPLRILEAIGGEAGCERLAENFYAHVAKDPILRPLFPGKTLRCATEAFGSFLIQFLGGDEDRTQHRWFLSLRESHAHVHLSPVHRAAWMKQMGATLDEAALDPETRGGLQNFFLQSSAWLIGSEAPEPSHDELAGRWSQQRILEQAVAAIATGHDSEALALASGIPPGEAAFVGLLARMLQTNRSALIRFVVESVQRDPSLATRRNAGRTLLHVASGAGCGAAVALLLRLGLDPNLPGRGGHTPLYCAANECASEAGPEVVHMLVRAGADVNAQSGVTNATPLHMAARRGHVEIARALLDCGAALNMRDKKRDTPLDRAINCRREKVAQLLRERAAAAR